MIGGRITNREAIVEIDVCGPERSGQTVKAVIDTGYNGYLTFPDDLVESLQLSFAGHRRGMLADGNIIRLDVYLAQLVWHGHFFGKEPGHEGLIASASPLHSARAAGETEVPGDGGIPAERRC